jgi:phage baseplate assembly protein W
MAAQLTSYQTSLDGATWIDVNTQFGMNNLPDRLPDAQAIQLCSLFNLFNCPIGSRSRIFQPEYGSMWYQFLQEPIDQTTANKMQIAMIQAIARWEPRINLDMSNSFITPDLTLPGYNVRLAFGVGLTSARQAINFTITQ